MKILTKEISLLNIFFECHLISAFLKECSLGEKRSFRVISCSVNEKVQFLESAQGPGKTFGDFIFKILVFIKLYEFALVCGIDHFLNMNMFSIRPSQ